MASPKKVVKDETGVKLESEIKDSGLNKDGFKKGAALTAEEYAKYKAKLK